MDIKLAIATIVGGFLFPFFIKMYWGALCDRFGAIGGFLAAGFIVGTAWTINHSLGLITQTGAWVDMGFAAGIGLIVADLCDGAKLSKSLPVIVQALVGGTLAGLILSFLA